MNQDKNNETANEGADKEVSRESTTVRNPFKAGEENLISDEEIEKEQEFKEASTERD